MKTFLEYDLGVGRKFRAPVDQHEVLSEIEHGDLYGFESGLEASILLEKLYGLFGQIVLDGFTARAGLRLADFDLLIQLQHRCIKILIL